MECIKENLEPGIIKNTYHYYNHSKYPLNVAYEIENNKISVTIIKMFKNHISKERNYSSKMLGKMDKEQIEGYILDCVELFLK